MAEEFKTGFKKFFSSGKSNFAVLALILMVIAGIVFILEVVRGEEDRLKNDLLRTAMRVARSLDVGCVHALAGGDGEGALPEHESITRQLFSLKEVFPDLAYFYVLGRGEDGSNFLSRQFRG